MPNFRLSVFVPENPNHKNISRIEPTSLQVQPLRCTIKSDSGCNYSCVAAFETQEAAEQHWAPLLQAFETEPSHVG